MKLTVPTVALLLPVVAAVYALTYLVVWWAFVRPVSRWLERRYLNDLERLDRQRRGAA